ncbi:MAG: HD-GYP domain-containing protein [Zoogloeaceae bacterium]|jgi:putative nucleotidyltransferase with HDIG domain|nr:HD-GYP domain-containing protein [Zoogloeaceae bacterium]
MLKRIDISQLKVGMFIREFCGSWLDHPFWRTHFLLNTQDDLLRIRQSAVREVWIDTGRGLDIAYGQSAVEESERPPPVEPPPTTPDTQPTDMCEEMTRAAEICATARESITSMFQEARMGRAIDAAKAAPLVDAIADSVLRNKGALVSLARLKTADNYTYMHSVAVCALMIALARQLSFTEAQVRIAGLGGILHDIGKMRIPPEILNKKASLTPEEFAIMKTHPQEGYKILEASGTVPESVMLVCLSHHEKLDGTGYPQRLANNGISPYARIAAICDVYDAITSQRAYKAGWDPAQSLHRMAGWKGHFDTALFHAFVRSLGIYPVGSLVRLASGRIGVVTEQHSNSLLTPRVRVFFSTLTNRRIKSELIDLALPGCLDKILSREEPADWNFGELNRLWGPVPPEMMG